MKTNKQLYALIEQTTPKSAWRRGVKAYALELVESAEIDPLPVDREGLKKILLNGADNWERYSDGGCALIYDSDIAARLCSPSELKKTKDGERQPNANETWLNCQARALGQALNLILSTINA